jgi:hypothetical protein
MTEEKKEAAWDIVRACFWLLASIIWAQILFAFAFFGACAFGVLSGTTPIGGCKDTIPNFSDLLIGGLAIIMAFSGKGSKNG